MEKVTRLAWCADVDARFRDFTNYHGLKAQVECGQAECFQIGTLCIIVRREPLADDSGFEVVWLASQGRHLKRYVPRFLEAAKRGGAKHIRFHNSSDEKAVTRLVHSMGYPIYEVERVYRHDLTEVHDGE